MTMSGPAAQALLQLRLRSTSAQETRELAAFLAAAAEAGDRLALIGPLGAGKTQFAKGFAIGLGIDEVVNSPSFTLMAEYEGRLRLFHQDLYRLAGAEDVLAGGLLDVRQDEGVTLSEWADRLETGLDPERLSVVIQPSGPEARVIDISGHGAVARRYLSAARTWRSGRDGA